MPTFRHPSSRAEAPCALEVFTGTTGRTGRRHRHSATCDVRRCRVSLGWPGCGNCGNIALGVDGPCSACGEPPHGWTPMPLHTRRSDVDYIREAALRPHDMEEPHLNGVYFSARFYWIGPEGYEEEDRFYAALGLDGDAYFRTSPK